MKCKHCGGRRAVKNGFVQEKQRYLCKDCNRTFRLGDDRERYTTEQRLRVLRLYLEGMGIMGIERVEGVPNPLIIQWIRKFGKIIKDRLDEAEIPDDLRTIQILELDELFTYCKKTKARLRLACC